MRKEKNKKQVLNFLVLRLAEGLWRKTTILMKARLPPATPQVITTHISGRTGSFSSTDYFVRRPSEMTVRSLGPKPDWISGSGFGFEVDIGIIWYLFLPCDHKTRPLMADMRSGFGPCMPISPWGTCWKDFLAKLVGGKILLQGIKISVFLLRQALTWYFHL